MIKGKIFQHPGGEMSSGIEQPGLYSFKEFLEFVADDYDETDILTDQSGHIQGILLLKNDLARHSYIFYQDITDLASWGIASKPDNTCTNATDPVSPSGASVQ